MSLVATKGKIKLSNGTFRHIEGELYAFHETKKELEGRKKEILHRRGFSTSEMGIGDPTGEKAATLVTDKRITHMEHVVKEIEAVYQSLSLEKKRLVKLLYWTHPQQFTWDGIARRLNVSKRQAQRWRRAIVEDIAERLGWQ